MAPGGYGYQKLARKVKESPGMLTEAWTRPKLQHRRLVSTAGGGARRVSAAWSMQGVPGPTDPSRKSGRGLWRCSGG